MLANLEPTIIEGAPNGPDFQQGFFSSYFSTGGFSDDSRASLLTWCLSL
jgi:hypothetical protein